MKLKLSVLLFVFTLKVAAQDNFGNCLHFNGGQHVYAPVHYNGTNGDFTLEVRFKSQNSPEGNLMYRLLCWNAPPDARLEIGVVHGRLTVYEYTGGNSGELLKSGHAITDGEWHHFAYVREGNKAFWYLDGQDIDFRESQSKPGRELLIGSWYREMENWTGCIDEIRIWNEARRPEQIRAYANKPLEPQQAMGSSLSAYYTFNQGIAGADNSNIVEVNDATGKYPGKLTHFELQGKTSNFVSANSTYPGPPRAGAAEDDFVTTKGVESYDQAASGTYRIPKDISRDVFLNAPLDADLSGILQYYKSGEGSRLFDTRERIVDHLGEHDFAIDSFVLRNNNGYYQSTLLKNQTFVVVKSEEAGAGRSEWTQIQWHLSLPDQLQTEHAAVVMYSTLAQYGELRSANMPNLESYSYQYVLKYNDKPRYFVSLTYSSPKASSNYIHISLTKADN